MANVNDVAIGNIFEHRFVGVIGTRKTQLVTRWQVIGLPAIANYPQAVAAIDTAINATWRSEYRACIPSNWTLIESITQRIAETPTSTPPVRSRGVVIGLNLPGTWAGLGLAEIPDVAGAILRHNYKAGKTEQGELRIGPLSYLAVTGSQLTGSAITALAALATKLVSNVLFGTGGVLAPVAWRRGTKAAPNQPYSSLLFSYAIGVNYTTVHRRKPLPFSV